MSSGRGYLRGLCWEESAMSAMGTRRDVASHMLRPSIFIIDCMRYDSAHLDCSSTCHCLWLTALRLLALKFFDFIFRPQYGGKFCPGSSRIYQLCNINPCNENSLDFRAQQCAEYNSKPFRGWFYQWKPYTEVEGNLVNMFLCGRWCEWATLKDLLPIWKLIIPDPSWPIFKFTSIGCVYFSTLVFFARHSLSPTSVS